MLYDLPPTFSFLGLKRDYSSLYLLAFLSSVVPFSHIYRVGQRLSYQQLVDYQWVTERFLLLPSTVAAASTLHSVKPWKLIYSPHPSHHLSCIICIL